jgi:threonylcarbamoyladenosine tRNA methylthiotransferase MtaB
VGNSHKQNVAHIAAERFAGANFVPVSDVRANAPSLREGCGTHSVELRGTQSAEIIVGDIFAHTELIAAPVFDAGAEKTRPNLKVQDGCDNRCSFCIIPFVRGQNRSLPLDRVLHEVDALVAAGYREVVISGINLGRWGRDFGKQQRFEDLVQAIVEKTALERLRISSVEPMDWSDPLIALVAGSPRLAKHAHVPMQSGSDRVLRKMHRKYRPWHYAEKITKIREAMPTAAIGADVMVGFPGETDLDFEETRAMIDRLPFTYLHVFTYSGRPGTPSEKMPDQVPVHLARERNRILRELAAEKKLRFMQSFVGGKLPAITLSVQENGCTEALTDNYLKMWLCGEHPENRMVEATVESASAEGLVGSI